MSGSYVVKEININVAHGKFIGCEWVQMPEAGNLWDVCHFASLSPASNEHCISKSCIGLIADVNVRLRDTARHTACEERQWLLTHVSQSHTRVA